MEVKINKEIREFSEAVFFGMSLRQCIFAALACLAAAGLYFLLTPYLGIETLSWVCIIGAAPFAALGFIKWHDMSVEQFVWAWIKSEVFTPKLLVAQHLNLYYDLITHPAKQPRERRLGQKRLTRNPCTEPDTTAEPAKEPQSIQQTSHPVGRHARMATSELPQSSTTGKHTRHAVVQNRKEIQEVTEPYDENTP